MKNPNLTKEQQHVLFDKATETPFTGKLLDVHDDGEYTCANCNAPLFHSVHKYESGSGWPSFDDAIKDSITFTTDSEYGMVRTEITCSNCGGHLGHVFEDGPEDTTGLRYCVNSLSLDFKKK
jgi:peptide-methionine (R)-S-oxide reductase